MVQSHTEQDVLKCEAKWALRRTAVSKANGCNGIPAELFRTLKDDTIKVLHSICQQIYKTHKWTQNWKSQSSSQFPRETVLKNVQTTGQLHSSPILERLCSKSSKLGLSIR